MILQGTLRNPELYTRYMIPFWGIQKEQSYCPGGTFRVFVWRCTGFVLYITTLILTHSQDQPSSELQ